MCSLHNAGPQIPPVPSQARSQAGGGAEAAQARKFDRGTSEIKAKDGAKKVELETFNPPGGETEVAGDRQKDTCPGRGESEPPAVVGEVLTDRSWRQHGPQRRHRIQDRLDEGVRVWTWPWAIVATASELVIFYDIPDFGNEALGTIPVDGDDHLWYRAKPAPVGREPVAPDRIARRSVIVPAVGRRALFLQHDPGVRGENATPPNGARCKDVD